MWHKKKTSANKLIVSNEKFVGFHLHFWWQLIGNTTGIVRVQVMILLNVHLLFFSISFVWMKAILACSSWKIDSYPLSCLWWWFNQATSINHHRCMIFSFRFSAFKSLCYFREFVLGTQRKTRKKEWKRKTKSRPCMCSTLDSVSHFVIIIRKRKWKKYNTFATMTIHITLWNRWLLFIWLIYVNISMVWCPWSTMSK